MRRPKGTARGFTLIELLIAVAIFAILGVMAYSGLNTVLDAHDHTRRAAERLQALQFAVRLMERDLRFFAPRPVRNTFGDSEPALVVRERPPQLVFTHGAARNPAGLPRAGLQRVAYLLEEETLQRITWTRLDGATEEEQIRTTLLDGVEGFTVRVQSAGGGWTERWPPPAVPGGGPQPLPQAVEIVLEGADWDEIRLLVPISVELPAQTIQRSGGKQGTVDNDGDTEDGGEKGADKSKRRTPATGEEEPDDAA